MLATVFALMLAATPAPPLAVPGSGTCPNEPPRIVEESNFVLPDGARPTHARVSFLIDVGSDGRVRRAALLESSGDAAVDAAATKTISDFRFGPPAYACVAMSTVVTQGWNVPPEVVAAPLASPAATAPASPPACAAPFVRPAGGPMPRHRQIPGTAAVDVSLDARARVTAVHLAHTSGNPKTDYAATASARTMRYIFERQPGCTPSATVYRMEFTFR